MSKSDIKKILDQIKHILELKTRFDNILCLDKYEKETIIPSLNRSVLSYDIGSKMHEEQEDKKSSLAKSNYDIIKKLRLESRKNSLVGSNYKLLDKNKNC